MTKFIVIVTIGLLISLVFAELAAGCGQVTHFADRTWVSNECLFLPSEISYGRW